MEVRARSFCVLGPGVQTVQIWNMQQSDRIREIRNKGGRAVGTVRLSTLLDLVHLSLVPTRGSRVGLEGHSHKIGIQENTVFIRWIGGTERIWKGHHGIRLCSRVHGVALRIVTHWVALVTPQLCVTPRSACTLVGMLNGKENVASRRSSTRNGRSVGSCKTTGFDPEEPFYLSNGGKSRKDQKVTGDP